jgi:hypothetical protein
MFHELGENDSTHVVLLVGFVCNTPHSVEIYVIDPKTFMGY